MITIEILEETSMQSDMADLLRVIADMIENGYTSGFDLKWSLSGEEAENWDDEEE